MLSKKELLNCRKILIRTLNKIAGSNEIDLYLQERFHSQYIKVCKELQKIEKEKQNESNRL